MSVSRDIKKYQDAITLRNKRIAELEAELELAKDTRAVVDKALHERRKEREELKARVGELESELAELRRSMDNERDMLRRGIRRHNMEFENVSQDAPGQYDLRLWALLEVKDE